VLPDSPPTMMFLAATGALWLTPASAAVSILVAILALVLTGLAVASLRRRKNPGLGFVAAAFFVFAVKNVFSAYNVVAHEGAAWPSVPHDAIELVLSLFDLVLLVLLFVPLFFRRRA